MRDNLSPAAGRRETYRPPEHTTIAAVRPDPHGAAGGQNASGADTGHRASLRDGRHTMVSSSGSSVSRKAVRHDRAAGAGTIPVFHRTAVWRQSESRTAIPKAAL